MKYKMGDLVKIKAFDEYDNEEYHIGLIVDQPTAIPATPPSGSVFYEILFVGENESDYYFEEEIIEVIE